MPLARRFATVTLYQGNYEAELAEMFTAATEAEEAAESARLSEAQGPQRMSTKSSVPALTKAADALAKKYDDHRAKAEKDAEIVTVWALGNDDFVRIEAEHPAREDNEQDKARGVNTKTFPEDLLLASLVDPEIAATITGDERLPELLAKGREILTELDLSRVQHLKVSNEAWRVNVSGDDLPKVSLVSLLKEQREQNSEPDDHTE